MIKFQLTGDVQGIVAAKDAGQFYVRISAPCNFKFPRPGEVPSIFSVLTNTDQIKGLSIGAVVAIEGNGYVGIHDFKSFDFKTKTEKTKKYDEFYFVASSIKVK